MTGTLLLVSVTVLLVLLAVLPGDRGWLTSTVSADAYGRHGDLASSALALFGLASASLGTCLALRLGGAGGVACGSLVGVWAVAAIVDSFVRTTGRPQTGTAFGQVHTMIAVAGIVAQVFAAGAYVGVVRRRLGHLPVHVVGVTTVVLAGVVFVATHPNSLAGLSERVLLTASAVWMLMGVRTAPLAPNARRQTGSSVRTTV